MSRFSIGALAIGLLGAAVSCTAAGQDSTRSSASGPSATSASTDPPRAESPATSPEAPTRDSSDTTSPEAPTRDSSDTTSPALPTFDADTTTIPRRRWPADADPSPGCAAPSPLTPGAKVIDSTAVAGRSSRLVVGPGIDDDYPSPVILLLHGRTSDGATIIDYSDFEPAADRLGALLVAPDASGANRAWTAADIGFLSSVLDELEAQQCVDRNRFWLAGLSLGGFMSARLACDLAGRFAAVGAVAGFGFDARGCAGAPVVPVAVFHGTADRVIPYDGVPPTFTNFEPSRGSARAITDWAAHNGCASAPIDVELSSEVTRRSFNGCRAETVLYTIDGGGHSWPGAQAYASQGHTTTQVSATGVFADLFARHVRGRTS